MFAEQLKMGDGAVLKLDCSHVYSGGEMKCIHCGQYPHTVIQHQIVEHSEIDFTDGTEYLRSQDV